jgi:serine/threonine protein kinase/tetratricopeptide (TPR) repeat protein
MPPLFPSTGDPVQVGPYRLDSRLGRGGMGEVYRGYDSRLERPVALKRIHPAVGDPELALRRFQREARAVARLRHPAIVQVHDWVEQDGEAWLVMELVEGTSLREMLRAGGRLEPARAIGLARDLLEGLAAAHEAGLVHRDLKAENVMISAVSSGGRGRGEQARILDFGLAKLAAGAEDESRLSLEGKIVGTLSALAPEQVMGEELDGRTDLFALGSLLYEALAGFQPFVGKNPGETLNRICTHHQLPLNEVRPEVPASLAILVDRLLQKDPRRRPASAADALAELEAVSGQGLADTLAVLASDDVPTTWENRPAGLSPAPSPAKPEPPPEPPPRPEAKAEPPAEPAAAPTGKVDPSGGQAPDYETARRRLPAAAAPAARPKQLTGTQAIRLVPRLRLAVAAALAALALLLAYFFWSRPGDPGDEVLYVVVPETRIEAPSLAEAPLAARAIHASLLQGLVDLRGIAALEPAPGEDDDPRALAREMAADEVLTATLACDLRDCRVLLRRVAGADGRILWAQDFTADPEELFDLNQAVLGFLPSAFPEHPRRRGVADLKVRPADYESYLRLFQRFLARDRGLSSDELLAGLGRLGASSPSFLGAPLLEAHVSLQRFQEGRAPADLERAERALARALELAPDNPQVLMLAARAARQAGNLDEAAAQLDRLRRLEPGNVEVLLQQALLAERMDQAPRALELAAQAAERRPSTGLLLNVSDIFARHGDPATARRHIENALARSPRSFGALSRLAQLELTQGAFERAAKLYRQLVERSPEATELTNLGTALMMLGRFEEAAGHFRAVAEKSPSSPHAALSLADTLELAGKKDEAAGHYRRVVELVEADQQPAKLGSVKAQALAHLGRNEEAAAAMQEALRLEPDNPWTAYEAALVFTLVGDHSSAGWNARRARRLGIEARWFALPFFEPVRASLAG